MVITDGRVILTMTEWEQIQKTMRDDSAAMRKAAARIARLDEELDELSDLLVEVTADEPIEPAPSVPEMVGHDGSSPQAANVCPIASHPKFKPATPRT